MIYQLSCGNVHKTFDETIATKKYGDKEFLAVNIADIQIFMKSMWHPFFEVQLVQITSVSRQVSSLLKKNLSCTGKVEIAEGHMILVHAMIATWLMADGP